MNLALLDAHIAAWDRGDTAEARVHAVKLRAYRDTIAPPEPVEAVAERPNGWRRLLASVRGLMLAAGMVLSGADGTLACRLLRGRCERRGGGFGLPPLIPDTGGSPSFAPRS